MAWTIAMSAKKNKKCQRKKVLDKRTTKKETAPSLGISQTQTLRLTASRQIRWALSRMLFAGIACLWFIAVVRGGLVELEGQFLPPISFLSSLLFLPMVFLSLPIAGAILNSVPLVNERTLADGAIVFGCRSCFRSIMFTPYEWQASQ